MNATNVVQFTQRLAQRTGLDLGLLDRPALADFVQRRILALGLSDDVAYEQFVSRDAEELERLIQEISVAETWFFRYGASYQLLVDYCAGQLHRRRDTLRMLSIACATGEEPYSMAMAATEAGWPLDRIDIDAVDRHEGSLDIAREAVYGGNALREELPPWAKQWFHREGGRERVDAQIVSTVSFARRDILAASAPADLVTYDVVFCRNLFIYLNATARTTLSAYIKSVLSPEGILFVGHAEYAIPPSDFFKPAGVRHAFALRPITSEGFTPKAPKVSARPKLNQDAGPKPGNKVVAPSAKSSPKVESPEHHRSVTLDDARAYADTGRLQEALDALEHLQRPRVELPEYYDLLGTIEFGLGRLDRAREAFNKVLYLQPNNEAALLQMAIISDRLGNLELAARFRRRAARAHDEESKPSP